MLAIRNGKEPPVRKVTPDEPCFHALKAHFPGEWGIG